MRRQWKMFMWIGAIGLLLTACGTTREARQEDTIREDFKAALAERQVVRRQQTAERCRRHGVMLPARYEEKGGGMLEDYVATRPPCGIPARERIGRAEADFRTTWREVMAQPVPLGYEWLLTVKHRIAIWLDTGGLTPADARTALREAQWILTERNEPQALPAAAGPGQSSGPAGQYFAGLNTALNQALGARNITCHRDGGRHPCF